MLDGMIATGFRVALTTILMATGIAPVMALTTTSPAFAQEIRMTGAERARLNDNRIGIVTGGSAGTYIKLGDDLRRLLDDHEGKSLRVVNMAGRGSVGNLSDLLYLSGVDVAIVQSDVLAHLRTNRREDYAYLNQHTRYLTRVYNEEIHILARDGITDVADLANKTVAVGKQDGGTSITADILFRRVFRIAPRSGLHVPARGPCPAEGWHHRRDDVCGGKARQPVRRIVGSGCL